MSEVVPFHTVPCGLGHSLETRGFKELTAIQEAVLDPAVQGRDLRLSSKTGSGKTVAIGLVVARELGELSQERGKRHAPSTPRALVVAPTRELAAQLGRELEWLYRPLRARHAVVTGGTNIGGDFRALANHPHVVVGTPGRLGDHVKRGSLDLSCIDVVVLDEADEMLDMGFRDELEALLDRTPEQRQTHLMSATFPRDVLRLANRYQRDAVMVQGSPAGKPNQDIKHVGHMVAERDKVPALVNVLLACGPQRTLVFVRTRVATSGLATELSKLGFSAAPLSGEMGQRERTATLESFRGGTTEVLVATDVAARGLDIEDVALVVHFDLPENSEVLTHRSGRTGRAGNKGTSIVLVPPQARGRADAMLKRVGVKTTWNKLPSPAEIRQAADTRLCDALAQAAPASPETSQLASRLLENHDAEALIATLLDRINHQGPCDARQVRDAKPREPQAHRKGGKNFDRPRAPRRSDGNFTRFHVNWGATHGATKPRVLAMLCRHGGIHGAHVGAIRVADYTSVVEVSADVATAFGKAVGRPDPRNPRVRIRPWRADG